MRPERDPLQSGTVSEIIIYCPECRTEYREGFTTCSECDVPLVRRLDSEVADPLVPLARERSFELVAELLDRLEKDEVPYVVQAGTALHLLDDRAAQGPELQPWEARVWVAASWARTAREIHERLVDEWRLERDSQVTRRYLDSTGSGGPGAG